MPHILRLLLISNHGVFAIGTRAEFSEAMATIVFQESVKADTLQKVVASQ